MKVRVILARFQPIHDGHLALIKEAFEENDKVLIIIGSADKLNKRNPIPINIRKKLVEQTINTEFNSDELDKFKIISLNDLTDEKDNSHDWGFYLYSNIVRYINQHYFTIYYSDSYEIITSWFPGFLLRNSISLKLMARENCKNGISATKVRDMILNHLGCVGNVVPFCVSEQVDMLKPFIEVFEDD